MEQCDNLDHLKENKETPIIPHAGVATINKYPGMYLPPVFLNMYFFSIKQLYCICCFIYTLYILFDILLMSQ